MRYDLPRYSSSIGKLKLHFSFKAKYCHKIFDDQRVKRRTEELFHEIAIAKGIGMEELGIDRDHAHMILSLKPNQHVSWIAKCFKGISARRLMQEFPHLRIKYFWGGNMWNPSYFFESVGKDEEILVNYVRNQGKNKEDKHQRKLTEFMPPASAGGS